MKKTLAKSFTKCLGFFILLLLTYKSNAQRGIDANTQPVPHMWFKHDPQVIKNFVGIKLPLIDEETRKIQPRSFLLGNFLGMIEYFDRTYGAEFKCLHIYIAAYSDEGSTDVPRNCGNLLTLIFAPAPENSSKSDLAYFIIPPDVSFDEDYADGFEIDKKICDEWTKNYIENVIPLLKTTYDGTKPENQIDKKPSDTRCITYCKTDIWDLVREQTFIHSRGGNKVKLKKSMIASFAAFGKLAPGIPGENRLFIQFDFLDDKGKIIHLEETFDKRNKVAGACGDCLSSEFNDKTSIKGLDNGQLCPPCTNCPEGYAGCSKKTKD